MEINNQNIINNECNKFDVSFQITDPIDAESFNITLNYYLSKRTDNNNSMINNYDLDVNQKIRQNNKKLESNISEKIYELNDSKI